MQQEDSLLIVYWNHDKYFDKLYFSISIAVACAMKDICMLIADQGEDSVFVVGLASKISYVLLGFLDSGMMVVIAKIFA